jgi:hypothetical protein
LLSLTVSAAASKYMRDCISTSSGRNPQGDPRTTVPAGHRSPLKHIPSSRTGLRHLDLQQTHR